MVTLFRLYGIKYNITQLHPARMGYGSCWSYPPFEASQTCPQTTFPPKHMPGPISKVGQPILLPPQRKGKS